MSSIPQDKTKIDRQISPSESIPIPPGTFNKCDSQGVLKETTTIVSLCIISASTHWSLSVVTSALWEAGDTSHMSCEILTTINISWKHNTYGCGPLQAMMQNLWPFCGPFRMDVSLKGPIFKTANVDQLSQNRCGPFFIKQPVLQATCNLDVKLKWPIW